MARKVDEKYLTPAVEAIRQSIEVLMKKEAKNGGIFFEDGKDIKLEADLLLSREICKRLSEVTGIRAISEEVLGSHSLEKGESVWIVDPLDGSMNFSRGLPLYCVSVALWQNDKPVMGIIHDLTRQRTFSACGDRAWVDGNSIRVSAVDDMGRAVLATGFPLLTDFSSDNMQGFLEFAGRFKKVRMLGTAALSLAWVAEGRMDVYFERDIMVWDVAAGVALVRGAGGMCIMRTGRHPMSMDVLAANSVLAGRIQEVLGW